MSPPAKLAPGRLAGLENVAQTIGTMGPTATLGTVLPLLMAKSGNASWALCLTVLLIFIAIAACVTVFAGIRTSAGSLGTYARMGLGRWPGIAAGWSYAIALTFVAGSSAVSSAYYLSLAAAHFTHASIGQPAAFALVALVVALAWWPTYHDLRMSARLMLTLEIVSVAAIVLIVGVAMAKGGRWIDRPQIKLAGADFAHVRSGFVLAFMVFAGFESATALGEESRDAKRVLPKVMLGSLLPTGLLFIGGIYCLGVLSHTHSLALDQTNAPFDVIAQSINLPSLGWVSSLGVALSCYGCALGGFNAGSRILYSLARSGQFWRSLRAVHSRNGTPYRALAFLAAVSFLVPAACLAAGIHLSDAMDYLMQIASFGFLGGYFLVALAAPVYLAKRKILRPGIAAAACVALGAIGFTVILSVYPLPDPPDRYLPLAFIALLIAGGAATASCLRNRRRRLTGSQNNPKAQFVVPSAR